MIMSIRRCLSLTIVILSSHGDLQAQTNSLMNVTRWRGTFIHRATDSGVNTRDDCTITWHVKHDVQIQSELVLDEFTLPHPTYRYWFSVSNLQESILVDEDYLESCPSSTGEPNIFRIKAAEHTEFPPRGFDLSINSSNGTYTIGFPAGSFVNARLEFSGDDDDPPIGSFGSFPFDNAGGHITRPLPTNGMVLTGSSRVPLSQVLMSTAVPWFFWSPFLTADVEVAWQIEPAEREEVELVVTLPDYENWRPQGSVDEDIPGNSMGIQASLQRLDGNPPQSARVKKFFVELLSVSREPGVCMNFPVNATTNGNPQADVQFMSELNVDWSIVGGTGEGIAMESAEGSYLVSPEATLSAFDWGAYALLQVSAELVDGRTLVGRLRSDATPGQIRIPKRVDGSLIADVWKVEKGVDGRSDIDDSEGDPEGDGHPGDGLALYEEYRGFYEGGPFNHISGHPKKKDLFVRDKIGNKRGYLLAAAISGLEIHHWLQDDEFPESRVINANHSPGAPHLVDQHGLLVMRELLDGPLGTTCGGPSIPKHIQKILIDTSASAVDSSGGVPWTVVSRNGKLILRDPFARLIAHELMHACNVRHHGRGDVRQHEWIIDRDQEGTIAFKEDGQIIRILNEGGTSIVPRPVTNLVMTLWLGVPGGQHSGDEECVMRYGVADAYRSRNPSNVRYWIDGDEIGGTSLCNHSTGTGVNATGRTPQSRYGDAARGNCVHQVCVNDAMNHAAGDPCE